MLSFVPKYWLNWQILMAIFNEFHRQRWDHKSVHTCPPLVTQMKQSTTKHKNRFRQHCNTICIQLALDNPGVQFRGNEGNEGHFIPRLAIFPIGPNISIRNKYLLGTSRKMIKDYVEIFISVSRNIELLILTMKTKYFCSAVVLEGFEI